MLYLRKISHNDLEYISDLIERNLVRYDETGQRTGYLFHNDFKTFKVEGVSEDVCENVYLILDTAISNEPLGYIYLEQLNVISPDLYATAFYMNHPSESPLIMNWELMKPFMYLKQIVVDERWRGRNIGTQALKLLSTFLRGRTLFSSVEIGNDASHRTHLKAGFKECGAMYIVKQGIEYDADLTFKVYTNNRAKLKLSEQGEGRWAVNRVNGVLGRIHSFGNEGFKTVYIDFPEHSGIFQAEPYDSIDVMILMSSGKWVNASDAFISKELIPDSRFEKFREPVNETEHELGFFYAAPRKW